MNFIKNSLKITENGALVGRQFAKRTGRFAWSIFRLLLLIGLSFSLLYPILYMLSMALRTREDLYDVMVEWVPKHFTLFNLERMFVALNYLPSLAFTFVLSHKTKHMLYLFLRSLLCPL